MEIIKNFGIEPVLLGAQIINFLILFFLLKKYAYKPIFKMLSDRKKVIEEGLKKAEEGRLSLEKALEEEKAILKKAQTNAQQILSEAKEQADAVIEEAREQTKVQVAQMLEESKRQMAQDTKKMEKDLAVSTATLAIDIVKEAIKNVFNEKEQEMVIKKMKGKIKK